jgi:starch synthase
MSKTRILYVSNEINPFLETTEVAKFVRFLPEVMQEKGFEIRILVPRFGCINERKNRLHEVVRLSGINITVGEEEKPLIIKVASIPTAKLQVYFLDNDDYFHRKTALHDKDEVFHADNDERAIFFCKGVLETVKKLGWSPDIVHCNGWMTGLIPLYLKTFYAKDPIYKDAKSVFGVFNNGFTHQFDSKTIVDKAKMSGIEDSKFESLKSADYAGFVKMGIEYADYVHKAEASYDPIHDRIWEAYAKGKIADFVHPEENADHYFNIYTEMIGVNELVEN